jgi:hypothetical protein
VRFEVFTAVTTKNGVFWDVTPCGSCKNRRFGGTYASVVVVTRIGELGTTLAVFLLSLRRLLVIAIDVHSRSDSCHPDEGGANFLRNVGYYKRHMA